MVSYYSSQLKGIYTVMTRKAGRSSLGFFSGTCLLSSVRSNEQTGGSWRFTIGSCLPNFEPLPTVCGCWSRQLSLLNSEPKPLDVTPCHAAPSWQLEGIQPSLALKLTETSHENMIVMRRFPGNVKFPHPSFP